MSTAAALEALVEIEVGDRANPFRVRSEIALERGVLVLFGPSGSGKSLTLRSIAGLERPASGFIRVQGETVFADDVWVPPHRRRIGYVPQHHSLFPFLDVRGNVAFGLPRSQRRGGLRAVDELLAELGIAHLAQSRPGSLSGGERQRVALARALAVRPRMLLLDEPFAAIDRSGRSALRQTLLAALRHHATPAVFVTHDIEEALEIADTVVLFERGETVGSGPPGVMLQAAPSLTLRGVVRGEPAAGPAGHSIQLDSAHIEGAERWVRTLADGEAIELEVRVRRHPRRD
jgi:molybdate transport system ATP-binding protein